MSNQEKSRKPLIIGIVAAVVILAALLALVLTNCVGGSGATDSTPVQTTSPEETIPTYDLYWNLDRAEYDGKSEAGMSSRQPESDGYFHVRFFKDGETMTLKVADRKTINAIDVNDLMDLEFDEDGIVIACIPLDDVPCDQVGWKFYVDSFATTLIKINSSSSFNGMELLLDVTDKTGIYDMTGLEGEVGMKIRPIPGDRVIAIADMAGNLTHVFVFERPTYMKTFEAECEHCGTKAEWKMWDKTDTLPLEAGHYQLQNDIKLNNQMSMKEDAKICLDLNGFAVDGCENRRMYSLHNVGAELAIMDTSEEQTGIMRAHGEYNGQGGVVWIRYGAFYLYAGTLDASDLVSTHYGAAVNVPKDRFFYMYGGTIIGGTGMYRYDATTGKYSYGNCGGVYVQGKFVMHDGVIKNGYARGAITARNANGTAKSFYGGRGGNLFIASGGEVEMRGGTIQNGKATFGGGNVCIDGTGVFTLEGGTITGGRTLEYGRNGGNVYVNGSKATLNINGGAIVNGVTLNCAGNVYSGGTVNMIGGYIGGGQCLDYATSKVKPEAPTTNVYNVNGKFYMYGGTIDGGFGNIDTAKNTTQTLVVLGGVARITGEGKHEYPDLTLNVGGDNIQVILANTLMDAAKIGVNTSMGIFTGKTSEANLDNFYSNVEGVPVVMYNGCLALGRVMCACGLDANGKHIGDCDGAELFWAPINTNAIPTGTGNYYLMKDIENVSQCSIAENATVRLDLNGYTLTAKEGYRAISVHNPGASFALTDSSTAKTGKIVVFGESKTQAACLWVRYGNATIYQGTLDASDFRLHQSWDGEGKDGIWGTKDDKIGGRNGVAVEVGANAVLDMYGGTIIGGTTISKTQTKTITEGEGEEATEKEVSFTTAAGLGGAISVASSKAVFNMYGGTIVGGTAHGNGGAMSIGSSATVNLHGGTIEGGFAGLYEEDGKTVAVKGTGGSIYLNGGSATLNILGDDVLITGGKSIGNGGNLYIVGGTLNMEAGTISKGESLTDQGGNLFNSGAANLTGGLITEGTAKNGGNIGINSGKDTLLQGVTVSNGVVPGNGGNIRSSSTNTKGTVTIAEGTVITGGKAKNGGNISVESNNYNKTNPQLNWFITGGTIENGEATALAGNIYLKGGGSEETGSVTVTISGGNITGGKTTAVGGCGGNIRLDAVYTTLNLVEGANISNGQAGHKEDTAITGWGGNIDIGKGTVNMSGGTVSGGWARNNGGSIRLGGADAVMNITAGTIYGGQNLDQGGNIWVGGSSVLNVDGTVTDGEYSVQIYNGTCRSDKNGGNIHANANATVTLNGVKIYGGQAGENANKNSANVNITNPCVVNIGNVDIAGRFNIGGTTSQITLYGKPVIKSAAAGIVSLQTNGNVLDISGLDVGEDEGMIGINASGKFAAPATEAQLKYFYSDFEDKELFFDEASLWAGAAPVKHCLCGDKDGHEDTSAINGCDGVVLTWTPWGSTTSLPKESGNYILNDNVNVTGTVIVTAADQIINIDLNGHTVKNAVRTSANAIIGYRLYRVDGTATNTIIRITDTAENGGGTIASDAIYDQGSIFWMRAVGTQVILLNGTIDGSGMEPGKNADGTLRNNYGANAIDLAAAQSKFVMYGGTFIGGNTPYGGDAIAADNWDAQVEIYGGTIKASENSPTGILIRSVGDTYIYGGEIQGIVEVNHQKKTSTLTLSGTPSVEGIYLSMTADNTLKPAADAVLPVINITGELGNTTPIKVTTMGTAAGYITGETVEANADKFVSGNVHLKTEWDATANKVKLVATEACICGSTSTDPEDHKHYDYTEDGNDKTAGCDGTKVQWTAWTSKTSLPTTTGNYYLTGDVKTGQSSIAANANVVLDLNGYTVSASGTNRIYSMHNANAKLTVTDLSGKGTGTMIRSETYTGQGGVLWARNMGGTQLTIMGGTFVGSTAAIAGSGNVVQVDGKSARCFMLGGEIIGGNSTSNGGSVYIVNTGVMYMAGGTITGGTSPNGGNVYVAAGGKLVVDGGTITDGFAKYTTSGGNGGNIYAAGEVQILKGEVTNGKAWKLDENGNPVYYEWYEEGGYNAGRGIGGNIYVAGKNTAGLTIGRENGANTDVVISGGISGGNGGNIYVGNGSLITVNCGTITSGQSLADNGGNIWVGGTDGVDSQLVINNGAITDGKAKNKGGNIHTNANAQVTLAGGTISGGSIGNGTLGDEAIYNASSPVANVNITAGTGNVTIGNVTINGYVKINKIASINISGDPQISTGTTNLDIGANKLTIGEMSATAKVGITANGAGQISTAVVPENYVGIFTSDDNDYYIAVTEGILTLEEAGTVHTSHGSKWTALTSETTTLTAGKWYLTEDTTLSVTATSGDVIICLNGHKWSGNAPLAVTEGTVSICDCATETVGSIGEVTVASGAALKVEGGEIAAVTAAEGASVTVSGDPKITNLNLGTNKLNVGELDSTASIGVSADSAAVIVTDAPYSYKAIFSAADAENYQVAVTANGLELMAKSTHVHCVCGGTMTDGQKLSNGSTHNCVDIVWAKASAMSDLATAGNWYLAENLNATAETTINNSAVNVCLNGCNITYATDAETVATTRAFLIKGTSSVLFTTCQPNQYKDNDPATNPNPLNNTIARTGKTTANGGIIKVEGGSAALNLYTVTLNGSDLKVQSPGSGGKHGGVINISTGTVTMYSGNIVGAYMPKIGTVSSHGGAIALETNTTTSVFNFLDGTIRDGAGDTGLWGGNVYIFKGTFNMYGGEIKNGWVAKADASRNYNDMGSNMVLRSTGILNMYGGQIHGRVTNKNTAGGKVNLYNNARIAIGDSTKGNCMSCLDLDITIYDLGENALIGLCYHGTNWDAMASGYEAASTGTGFVEAEDMSKLGIHTVGAPSGATYGLKLEDGKIIAYKTN